MLSTNPTPLVSAIITNYNYAEFLGEAIESVLAQTYSEIEVLVVDDGSTDHSREVLDSYGERIRAVFQDNGGQTSALNTGIKAARGDFLCFLDADDTWFPGKVAAVLEKYRGEPWGLVSHHLSIQYGSSEETSTLRWTDHFGVKLLEGELLPRLRQTGCAHSFGPPSGLAMPAWLAKEIAPLPTANWPTAADSPMALSAAIRAPAGVIDQPLGTYRLHPKQRAGSMPVAERTVWHLDHAKRSVTFLEKQLQRQGDHQPIDLQNCYTYQRRNSLLTAVAPLLHAPRICSLALHQSSGESASLPSRIKDAVQDLGALTGAQLGVSKLWRQARKIYRSHLHLPLSEGAYLRQTVEERLRNRRKRVQYSEERVKAGRPLRMPDFLIIGAMKSGTTSAVNNLDLHPGLALASRPNNPSDRELHFFTNEWDKGLDYYSMCFPDVPVLVGEKTPTYFSSTIAHERMASAVPDAKLIVLLRNPIDRAYSHWNHFQRILEEAKSWGWRDEPFEQSVENDQGEIVSRGFYSFYLDHLLRFFRRDQIHVVIAERSQQDMAAEYAKIFRFLGVDDSLEVSYLRHNLGIYTESISPETRTLLARQYANTNQRLREWLQDDLPEWS